MEVARGERAGPRAPPFACLPLATQLLQGGPAAILSSLRASPAPVPPAPFCFGLVTGLHCSGPRVLHLYRVVPALRTRLCKEPPLLSVCSEPLGCLSISCRDSDRTP